MSGSPRDSSAGSSGDAAIVTGGGSGLGRAIARRLATAGTRVAVLARTEDQLAETVALIEGAGGEAVAVRADVSDPAAVGAAFRPSSNSWALSTSSSTTPVAGPVAPFWEADPEEWWRAVEVNLRDAALCCRAVLPGMVARKRGRIVDLTSNAGVYRWPHSGIGRLGAGGRRSKGQVLHSCTAHACAVCKT